MTDPDGLTERLTPQTYGDLKKLLAQEPRGDWPSRVNRGMTHSQVLDVLIAGLKTYPDEQRIGASLRGDLYTRNVLRECRSHGDNSNDEIGAASAAQEPVSLLRAIHGEFHAETFEECGHWRCQAPAPVTQEPIGGLITACCGVWIGPDHRFCPQCGYEARVEPAAAPRTASPDLQQERDEARYNARILAHAYTTDNRPPSNVVKAAMAYPVRATALARAQAEGQP